MQVLPVLDILDGAVVRGVAGCRTDYRPIVSRLTLSCDPLTVANAIRDKFGLTRFYVADLDGILKRQPNRSLYRRLAAGGFQLLIDSGIREPSEARWIGELPMADAVVGLETCPTPDDLRQIVAIDPRVTFSLDLMNGVPCVTNGVSPVTSRTAESERWSSRPEEILQQAIRCNVTCVIILDLSDVGMATGGSANSLCQFVRNEFPNIRLITGGGVRDREDLKKLSDQGVDAALVASALHDGRLRREDLSML